MKQKKKLKKYRQINIVKFTQPKFCTHTQKKNAYFNFRKFCGVISNGHNEPDVCRQLSGKPLEVFAAVVGQLINAVD